MKINKIKRTIVLPRVMQTVFNAILTIPRQESAAADKLYAKATQSRSIKALKHYRDIKQHKKY
jgi:hypothetical protein